jgi:hypothetical protein
VTRRRARGTRRPVGLQGPPQRADEGLHRADGALGRVDPEVVDQPGHRHDAAARDQQAGQHLAVAGPAQVERPPAVLGLQRAEHPEHHHLGADATAPGGRP